MKRDQLRCYILDFAAPEKKVNKFLYIQHRPAPYIVALLKIFSPCLLIFLLGFSERFNKQIHGLRPHKCQRDIPIVSEQRATV